MSKSENRSSLGNYLANVRAAKGYTLREVEEATDRRVSNAYLSQLEHSKISKPSPNVLYSLAQVYGVPYETLMERAGYISPVTAKSSNKKHGRAATFAMDDLTPEEEEELLTYLAFLRSKRRI
ncbi:helix-turn-helix transcriptional regulator [bacterium]|nr:helix-turn-helix transcriptional regulator [bacterium]